MSRVKWLLMLVPVGHVLLWTGYGFWSGEPAGTAMSIIFGIAMAVMIYILVPTVRDVGPTAPVDQAWAEHTGAPAPAVPPEERDH